MDIDFNKIKAVHMEEKSSRSLSKVHPDFYEMVRKLLEEEKHKLERRMSELGTKINVEELYEYQNVVTLVKEIIMRRMEKVARLAVADAVFEKEPSTENMVDVERELYHTVRRKVEDLLYYVVGGEKRLKSTVLVRIVKDVPAVLGLDMRTYGPFRAGEEVPLPKDVAERLVKEGYAEVIK